MGVDARICKGLLFWSAGRPVPPLFSFAFLRAVRALHYHPFIPSFDRFPEYQREKRSDNAELSACANRQKSRTPPPRARYGPQSILDTADARGSTRQSEKALPQVPAAGKENPRGDQRVGRGVGDHSITDSPAPHQHAGV